MTGYTVGIITGAIGLAAMAFSGLSHHDGGAHTSHGGPHAHSAGSHHGHTAHHHTSHLPSWLLTLLTPRAFFTALVGFGATGLATPWLPGPIRVGLAIAGGLAFEIVLAGPLSRVMLGFASRPALTLESCVMDEALAVANFDADGRGLVSVELDGQLVQVLATLRQEDLARGARIRSGDTVRVEEVDGARQQLVVSAM
jgi:hypothetical protein